MGQTADDFERFFFSSMLTSINKSYSIMRWKKNNQKELECVGNTKDFSLFNSITVAVWTRVMSSQQIVKAFDQKITAIDFVLKEMANQPKSGL